jgi:hypothetical protein
MFLKKLENFWLRPVDRRVYSLFQIFYAVVTLCNLVQLFPDRYLLLSDQGLFSNSPLLFTRPLWLFRLADSPSAVDLFFALTVLAAFALIFNVLPRAASIYLFLWQLSCTTRLGPAVAGWDFLLVAYGLTVMISPSREAKPPVYGLRLIQLNIVLVYWEAVFNRWDNARWRNGEAVSYFLNSDMSLFPTTIGHDWPLLAMVLTYSVLAIEIALPVLLWNKRTRYYGFALGCALHGFLLFTVIPVFSLTVMTGYLAFLSGEDLDRLPLDRLSLKIKKLTRSFGRRFADHA